MDTDEGEKLYLASWDERATAWLIDFLLVGVLVSSVGEVGGVFSITTGGLSLTGPAIGVNVALWVYWTVLEGYQGQSAGKLYTDIAVAGERGEPIGYVTAAIESFGKAFLLPLDVLVGWGFGDGAPNRLFNTLSSTIVIRVTDDETDDNIEYVYPDE